MDIGGAEARGHSDDQKSGNDGELALSFLSSGNDMGKVMTLADGHKAFPTESLDFDLTETKQYMEYVTGLGNRDRKAKGGIRWCLLFVAGALTGMIAVGVDWMVKRLFRWRFELVAAIIDSGAEAGDTIVYQYLAYTGYCVAGAMIAGYLVCFVEPLAAGSGIPEVKCYLNGVDLPRVVDLKTLVAKAPGVMFSVSAGLPCGKEGPMIHSGAICGALVSRMGAGQYLRAYRETVETRDFVVAGAASGVAAAFGAPVGGVLFAIEEGATHWSTRIMLRTFVCCMSALLVVRFFLAGEETSWGEMGGSAPLSFGYFERSAYEVWELPLFALIGVIGGLMGAAFNQMNTVLTKWRMRNIGPRGPKRYLEAIFITIIIASFHFFMPIYTDGKVQKKLFFSNSSNLYWDPGAKSINNLFHTPEYTDDGELSFGNMDLFIFGTSLYFLACWVYGLGVPSGLFVPSLLVGATFGRIAGQLNPLEGAAKPGVYALMGATAMLSGMARITISLAVILMEATGDSQWALPIFMTVMVTKWVGDWFTIGLYDIHIELKHVPMLEPLPEKDMIMLRARDVMSQEVLTMEPVEIVRDLMKLLEGCKHHGFPVVQPGTGRFVGIVKRDTLHQVLLSGEAYSVLQSAEGDLESPSPCVPYEKTVLHRNLGLRGYPELGMIHQKLKPEDYSKRIDLRPYINRGCYTVPEHAAVTRVYVLFRNMGLRHLPVVSHEGHVLGIVTRKDLIMAHGEEHGVQDASFSSLAQRRSVTQDKPTRRQSLLLRNGDDSAEEGLRLTPVDVSLRTVEAQGGGEGR